MDLSSIWAYVLEKLRASHPPSVYNIWFAESKLTYLDSTQAIVSVNSDLKRDFIEKKYKTELTGNLETVLGAAVDVYLKSEEIPSTEPPKPLQPLPEIPEISIKSGDDKERSFHADYTFDNFIVGSSNKLAHAASVAVSNNPVDTYNPLFIHGASGLGKTHLLYAIMNQIKQRNSKMQIVYVKGEQFTNELIESISHKTTPAFRSKYRTADILLIDDIQFIAGKESIQEEFFHTFNALYEDKRQIVLTSDRPPRDMKTLEDRLKTRFEWGLLADISIPDFELRIAIMKTKATSMGITLPNEVLTFLAENLKSNIRQLEGAIKKIGAQCFLNGQIPTIQLARECTGELLIGNEPVTVTVDKIISKVAAKYGLAAVDIKSRKKTKEIAAARHMCIYIIRKLTDMSFPAIGKALGRDHSTVLSSHSLVETEMNNNMAYEMEVDEMIKDIREG